MEIQTPAEQLLFVTVRIETTSTRGIGTGTAFIFAYKRDDKQYPFLVTNKHVVADATRGQLFLTLGDNDGKPLLGQHYDLLIDDFENEWYGHPDDSIDITVMPLVSLLKEVENEGKRIFYRSIGNDIVPTPDQSRELDAVEETVFVGYPSGLFDATNLLPIVRRATTATPFQVDYEGQPVFLIDASVFPGSSGSPLFIANSGGYAHRSGGFVLNSRLLFLGVVSKVVVREDRDRIEVQPIPTARISIAKNSQMINLGVVYKSSTVVETIEALFRERGELEPTS